MNRLRRGVFVLAATGSLVVVAVSGSPAVMGAAPPRYAVANVGPYGGEPSIVSDHLGRLYDTTPSGGTITYRSVDHGATWTPTAIADPSSGDDCLATDQENSVYLCNLAGSEGAAPLQADVWKSTNLGASWSHGSAFIPQCGSTSCSPFGVDRDWVAASIPQGGHTNTAEVVLMYHDFYGPSQIWVNISQDGGATFGAPQEVLASPNVTPGAVTGTLVAQGYTFCNTVPAGVAIVPPGLPHAGRIFVAWIAADLAQNATGCNASMLQSFHTVWISYSDDRGAHWTPQQAWDAGFGHDTSTPFVAFTLDDRGNPYFGLTVNASSNPVTCSAESTAGTVQSGRRSRAGGRRLPEDARDPSHRSVRQGGSGRMRRSRHRRQPAHLSAGLPVEPVRSAVAQPHVQPEQGFMVGDADHHHSDAHRGHLQPGHLLRSAELQSQPARLHHGGG